MPVFSPGKYPRTGPNYAKYGEVPGYVYYPWNDQYYLDPKEVKKYNEQIGATEKPKGLMPQLAPVVAAAGATALGMGLIKNPEETIDAIGSIPGKVIDLPGKIYDKVTAAGDKLYDKVVGPSPASGAEAASASTSGAQTATTATTTATQPITAMGTAVAPVSIAPGAPVPEGYTAVATNMDGSTAIVPSSSIQRPGVSAGDAVQGVLGGYQVVQGLTQLGKGNYLGGGLNTVTGAANLSALGGRLGIEGIGSQTATAALPYLNAAAGVYQGVQTANMIASAPSGGKRNAQGAIGGAASGAALGSVIPGVGTGLGAIIGGITGLTSSIFGSSKGESQMYRDKVRSLLQKNKILDEKYRGTLADGTTYDFGGDGSKIKVDYKDATTGRVIGLANVLSAAEGHQGKGLGATAELYTSGAMSNAGGDYNKAKANIQHFAQQRGMNRDNVIAQINKMAEAGQITKDQAAAYINGANELFTPIQPERRRR